MSKRFARVGWPRTSETSASITVTGSATPHAEGTYTQILASTAADVCAIIVGNADSVATNAADTSMLLTLAVGGAGSEVDIVSNIVQGGRVSTISPNAALPLWLPIHIPAGTRVSAKLRAEQVSDTYVAPFTFLESSQMPGWGGYSICDTLGADTANSKGTDISNTAGTWTQIVASTTSPLKAFSIACGLVDATAATITHIVDVGIGGAGSEEIIGTWVWETTNGEQVMYRTGPPFLARPIAAGSRIAIKKDTTGDLSAVVLGWR